MSNTEINKYEKGKIYKILNTVNDDVYVGSTYQALSRRMAKHRSDACSKNKNHRKLYLLMNHLGIDNFFIELVENYPCSDKDQLRAREGFYIRQQGTLNIYVAGRAPEEYVKQWREENKESIAIRQKLYAQSHREQIAKTNQKYNLSHPDEVKQRKQQWVQRNKDKLAEKKQQYRTETKEHRAMMNKKYRAENKDKINSAKNVKMCCPCGGSFNYGCKARHYKTQIHKAYEENIKSM